MSEQNLEVVRRAHEAWNAEDPEAFIAEFHPDIAWQAGIAVALVGSETAFRGHDGLRSAWMEYNEEALGDLRTDIDLIRDLGESVLLLGHMQATGRSTALGFRQEFGQLLGFRDGKIATARDFLSHAETLEAAGVSG